MRLAPSAARSEGSALLEGVRAVAFDAFGTLVEIGDKRRPYARLLASVPADVRDDLRARVMRERLSLDACIDRAGDAVGAGEAATLRADLAAELASIRLRPNTLALWAHLRGEGVAIAICSNLAELYGPPLLALLPDEPDALVLSYEVGCQKPEPAIYALVAERLGLPAGDVLFTGDTPEADVDGPRAAGMKAVPIGEFETMSG